MSETELQRLFTSYGNAMYRNDPDAAEKIAAMFSAALAQPAAAGSWSAGFKHGLWQSQHCAPLTAGIPQQPAVSGEPVAWAQLGMRNGHTYVRMHYEGHLYPPPPDVQRNLNLVPLYAAPAAQQEPKP